MYHFLPFAAINLHKYYHGRGGGNIIALVNYYLKSTSIVEVLISVHGY